MDSDGTVEWRDFVPVMAKLLRQEFEQRNWAEKQENPWVKLHDREHDAHYFYNRETGERWLARQVLWAPMGWGVELKRPFFWGGGGTTPAPPFFFLLASG